MKVCVLLSTYNGETYLAEQLESIFRQKQVALSLYVRDDGSQDRTWQILSDYAQRYANLRLFRGENLGAAKVFFGFWSMPMLRQITLALAIKMMCGTLTNSLVPLPIFHKPMAQRLCFTFHALRLLTHNSGTWHIHLMHNAWGLLMHSYKIKPPAARWSSIALCGR
ncbi:MAG: hypothetical protein CMR00_09065 [[Chlorobium] sp. 445]|nr:MAG: hypothetical protein CMR00_09065 [[Chlorobium] sp. 445]